MKRWQDFLDSLSTKGGNILVTLLCVTGLLAIFLHVIHHGTDSADIETFKSILSGFAGALLAMLSGSSSRQQMQDRVDTVRPPSVGVQTAGTVNVEANKSLDSLPAPSV